MLPFIAACNMSPMTTTEINELYSNSTSLSSNKASANYYASDGTYKTTNLKTRDVGSGNWYTKEPNQICISTTNEMCFELSKSDTEIAFKGPNGRTSTRKISEYLRGNQTEALAKAQ